MKNPLRGSCDNNQPTTPADNLKASMVSSLKMQSSVEKSKENLTGVNEPPTESGKLPNDLSKIALENHT